MTDDFEGYGVAPFERRRLPEPPVRRDPAARYDGIGRKLPKKIGLLEAARGLPWLAERFAVVVPANRWVMDAGQAVVQCRCDEVAYCPENVPAECPGGCGRWFWLLAGVLRVARDSG